MDDVYGQWASLAERWRALQTGGSADELRRWNVEASDFMARHGATLDRWYGTGAVSTLGDMIDHNNAMVMAQDPNTGQPGIPDYLGSIFSRATANDMVETARSGRMNARLWWAEGGGATVLMLGVGALLLFAFRK